MKGLVALSKKSQNERVHLYYNIMEDKVYSDAGKDRFYLTDLIRPNDPKEIENTVHYMMSL